MAVNECSSGNQPARWESSHSHSQVCLTINIYLANVNLETKWFKWETSLKQTSYDKYPDLFLEAFLSKQVRTCFLIDLNGRYKLSIHNACSKNWSIRISPLHHDITKLIPRQCLICALTGRSINTVGFHTSAFQSIFDLVPLVIFFNLLTGSIVACTNTYFKLMCSLNAYTF